MFEHVHILDLTKVLDENLEIYSEKNYRDPDFGVKTWCTIEDQGYWVSQLSLGTQTGTHIDAPAHFKQGGATLDTLATEQLVGRYCLVDLDRFGQPDKLDTLFARYDYEPVLLLSSQTGVAQIAEEALQRLCRLPSKVWLMVGGITVTGKDPLYFHRALAEQGIFLIEDVDVETAKHVKTDGTIIALPLRLKGVSGSPCRVLILQESQDYKENYDGTENCREGQPENC